MSDDKSSVSFLKGQASPNEPKAPDPVRFERAKFFAFRTWGIIGALVLIIAAAYVIKSTSSVFLLILIAIIIAFIANPLVNWLEQFKVPRGLGTLIAYLIGIGIIAALGFIIVPIFAEQLKSFFVSIPAYLDALQDTINDVAEFAEPILAENTDLKGAISNIGQSLGKATVNAANSAGDSLISAGSSVVGSVVTFFMAIVVGFWIVMDLPKITKEVSILAGPRRAEELEIVSSVLNRAIGGYMKGILITSTCTGVLAGIGFAIIGLPYSGLLGLMTGLLNVIPYIGPWTGGAIAAIVGLFVSPLASILSIVVTVAAQQFTDTFIGPVVMKSAVSVHPALVIIGLLLGGTIGGILGMIIALPVIAAIKGVFVYYFEKRTGRQIITDKGAFFDGQPFNDEAGDPIPALDATGGSKYYSGIYASNTKKRTPITKRTSTFFGQADRMRSEKYKSEDNYNNHSSDKKGEDPLDKGSEEEK